MNPDSHTNQETFINVGNGHSLYVHDWGNKHAALPIVFLHGGPGGSVHDSHKQLFDPTRERVIFFDQRGCGKSTAAGLLEHNTTPEMVEDIETIISSLGIRTCILTGSSWGSCLALAYGIAHPERVAAMVLRGIFTGSQAEIDWLNEGRWSVHFPDVWDRYLDSTPVRYRNDPSAYHSKRVLSDNEKAVKESAYIYASTEGALHALDDRFTPYDYETFDPAGTIIEIHYMQNRCFMPDRFIIEHAAQLTMPIWLVQGRYDFICPPVIAYELHHRLPDSQLIMTVAGHGNDRPNYDVTRTLLLQLNHA